MQLYRVSLQFNESYAFRDQPVLNNHQQVYQKLIPDLSGASKQEIHRCDTCGGLVSKWDEPLLSLKIKKRKYDISITYDGVLVVSDKFKSVCESNHISGLNFRTLQSEPSFFAPYALRFVEFDTNRRKTEFINCCPQCGHFESVIGATPVFLAPGSKVGATEFVRTNLEFGSGDGKSPVLICGESAAMALNCGHLKGLNLVPIKENVFSQI